jgi:hypothetical protein
MFPNAGNPGVYLDSRERFAHRWALYDGAMNWQQFACVSRAVQSVVDGCAGMEVGIRVLLAN